jgi:hypothetical protein
MSSKNSDSARIGKLNKASVQDNIVDRTLEFISTNLPPWRDDPDRSIETAEEELNAQLSNFLQAKATHEFPMVQFQHEQRQTGRRRVDLSAKPTCPLIICGTYYSIYKPFLVIEGKRLPAPDKLREREYLTGGDFKSGGIQRFKLGLHGKDHDKVVMIGYVQSGRFSEWEKQLNEWIVALADSKESGSEKWGKDEILSGLIENRRSKICRMRSVHARRIGILSSTVEIVHLWITME